VLNTGGQVQGLPCLQPFNVLQHVA
jgi:hypothetical protein